MKRMRLTPLGIFAGIYLVFLYAPIILLPMFAFNDGTIIAFPLQGFTTRWFYDLLETPALHAATRNSLAIAVSVAVLSTVLGLFAARAATRYRFPGKAGIVGFIMLPLVLPEVIVAISLLTTMMMVLPEAPLLLDFTLGGLSVVLGIDPSLVLVITSEGRQIVSIELNLPVIFGHTLLCMPFAIAILQGSFAGLDQSLEEAAVDLGETRAGAFRLIILPLVAPGIIASLLICFIISLDEFIIAFFLSGNEPTLPVYLWGQLRFPARLPVVMALGTILVALSVTLLIIANFFRRRGLARTGQQDSGGFL